MPLSLKNLLLIRKSAASDFKTFHWHCLPLPFSHAWLRFSDTHMTHVTTFGDQKTHMLKVHKT